MTGRGRQIVGIENGFLTKVLSVDDDFAVYTRRDGGERGEIDSRRHHESFSVISMFADKVYAARCNKNSRFRIVAGFMNRAKDCGIVHRVGSLEKSPGFQ